MFEHRTQTLLPREQFYRRVRNCALLSAGILVVALGIGMTGYHCFENLNWVDAFVNAAMILSGMGPVSQLNTDGGKIFAGCYALFSGLVFITATSILLAPVAHRALHKFHLESGKQDS
ncbi:MAG TPA: hypothetical protein VGI03_15780 [Verrucomicrobiae bacterium]|jgi:hypothetical protein